MEPNSQHLVRSEQSRRYVRISRARMGPWRGTLPKGRGGDGATRAADAAKFWSNIFRERRWPTKRPDATGTALPATDLSSNRSIASDATYLADLNRARAEATERSGLHALAPLTVRVFASTPAFREATLAPGWVAAFTEGDWIGTQPLRTLAATTTYWQARCATSFCMRCVEQQAGPTAPLWLREGLVEFWSEPSDDAQSIDRRRTRARVDDQRDRRRSGARCKRRRVGGRASGCRVVCRATPRSLRARAGARLAALRCSRWRRRRSRAAVA